MVEEDDLQILLDAGPVEVAVGGAVTLLTVTQAMNREKTSMNTTNWRRY